MESLDHNLRDPHHEWWYWDRINEVVQDVTGREKWRMSDIDGAGQLRGRFPNHGRVLLAEGSRVEKPNGGQVEMLKDLALKPDITVVSFIGDYPEPPDWVVRFAGRWADGSLPAEGYWTEERYEAHGL